MKRAILPHIAFWLFSVCLLTLIYGVAFGSYVLGIVVILLLLPVHMAYFYAVAYWIIPRYFFRRKFFYTGLACLLVGLTAAVLYRLDEIWISDPYIFRFYRATDPAFTWAKLEGTVWQQLLRPGDFVNAVERSNVVVWIGVSFRFVQLWYERRQAGIQAELAFLKGQIHPHFLFNTLNNLYSLALQQSAQTPPVILGLSNILHYMLYECNEDSVLLKRDIEILKSFIGLEKIRYEERLELNFSERGPVEQQKIAPLLMLPLVENAFKHGVSETVDQPWINIEIVIDPLRLIFKVSNSKPPSLPQESSHFKKVGLTNVRKRLELLYPEHYMLELCEEEDLFIAVLELDLIEPKLLK